MEFIFKRSYNGKVKSVIFDWAGTTVDFGCFAPAGNFVDVFKKYNVDITIEEARIPMGLHKRDHIREITKMTRINNEWFIKNGKYVSEDDVNNMFADFIPRQLELLPNFTDLIPNTAEVVDHLRVLGLKIGSTTGYNNEMMEIVTKAAKQQGYETDCLVCASDVPAGRPAPWMIFKNAMMLDVYPLNSIVKVGDTISDIEEGLNANVWSVGIVEPSNEMGMRLEDVINCDPKLLEKRKNEVRKKFLSAGAHFVIDTIEELPALIEKINYRLSNF